MTTVLLGVHLLLVQRHGMSVPPADREARPDAGHEVLPRLPPARHGRLVVAVALLAALAAFFPWELGVKADPFAPAPAGIRPEWYFLWTFQRLKYLPAKILGIPGETLGVLFLGGLALLFVLVPLLDRKRSRAWDIGAVLLLIGAGILTVLSLMPVKG